MGDEFGQARKDIAGRRQGVLVQLSFGIIWIYLFGIIIEHELSRKLSGSSDDGGKRRAGILQHAKRGCGKLGVVGKPG